MAQSHCKGMQCLHVTDLVGAKPETFVQVVTKTRGRKQKKCTRLSYLKETVQWYGENEGKNKP